jgi:hypothetical protein
MVSAAGKEAGVRPVIEFPAGGKFLGAMHVFMPAAAAADR